MMHAFASRHPSPPGGPLFTELGTLADAYERAAIGTCELTAAALASGAPS